MKIFTIVSLLIMEGAEVEKFKITEDIIADVVKVGEKGIYSSCNFIPVKLLSFWDGKGSRIIKNAIITQIGSPRFFEIPAEEDKDEEFILVFKTKYGLYGHNYHGIAFSNGEIKHFGSCEVKNFRIIAQGVVTNNKVANSGWGFQYIVVVKPPIKFLIGLTGCLRATSEGFFISVEKTGIKITNFYQNILN